MAKKTKKKASKPPKKRKLRLDRFPIEFLKDFNGTQAAIRIGCPPKGAAVQASRLLRNVKVQEKLRELIKKQEVRTGIDSDTVLKEAARIALADIGPAFNDDNTLKDIKDIPEDLRRIISGVKTTELFEGTGKDRKWTGYTKEIKFWSKDKHVELLMRHLGLFLKDNEQRGSEALILVLDMIDGGTKGKLPSQKESEEVR